MGVTKKFFFKKITKNLTENRTASSFEFLKEYLQETEKR
jgi:hypothetical protein